MSHAKTSTDLRTGRGLASAPAHPVPDLNQLVRALSHDLNANFMLLQHSITHLQKHLQQQSPDQPLIGLTENAAHVDACLQQSRRLLDDLVVLAKTGRIEMDAQQVELDEIVRQVLFEQAELFHDRGIDVTAEYPMPAAWCHPTRIHQVLTNLVRNAALHGCPSPGGRIVISSHGVAETDEKGDGRPLATIVVADDGPGVPAADRETIFLPGRRLTSANPEGSGMGLVIVRQICEHFGGSVMVDPDHHPGTAMVVRLPAAARPQG